MEQFTPKLVGELKRVGVEKSEIEKL